MQSVNTQNSERFNINIFFLLFSLGNLAPIWILNYFPSVDGPAHVFLSYIWLHHGESAFPLYQDFFERASLNSPNMLIYIILYLLMNVFEPFTSEKILLSLFVVGLPLSVRYLVGSLDRKAEFFALLSFPIVFNYILFFGFYNFLFGTIFYCISIGFWIRHSNEISIKNSFYLFLLVTGSYFTHLSSAIFVVLSLAILIVGEFLVLLFSGEKVIFWKKTTDISKVFAKGGILTVASLPVVFLIASYFLERWI